MALARSGAGWADHDFTSLSGISKALNEVREVPLVHPGGSGVATALPAVTVSSTEVSDGVLRLRPVKYLDAAAHLAGEDAARQLWVTDGPSTRASVAQYIADCVEDWERDRPVKTFAIEDHACGAVIGLVEVSVKQPFLEKNQANIAYALYPAYRGKGNATRAVGLAGRYITANNLADEAIIRVHPDNTASKAVAERCGFAKFRYTDDRNEGSEDSEGPLVWYVKALHTANSAA